MSNHTQETKTDEQRYIDCILAMCGGDTHEAFEFYQASIYGESHDRNEDETEEQWFERCAEQDFADGCDACMFPQFYPGSEEFERLASILIEIHLGGLDSTRLSKASADDLCVLVRPWTRQNPQ